MTLKVPSAYQCSDSAKHWRSSSEVKMNILLMISNTTIEYHKLLTANVQLILLGDFGCFLSSYRVWRSVEIFANLSGIPP